MVGDVVPLAQVTGGQGYIGSHTVLVMLEDGYSVTVVTKRSKGAEL